MPLIFAGADPSPVDPEIVALRERVARLEAFVEKVRAEYAEPGAITRSEIKAALDTLT